MEPVVLSDTLHHSTSLKEKFGGDLSPSDFDDIADYLINHTILLIGDKDVYMIRELEFYLYSDSHPDIYTHRNNDQKESGSLYFHKHANGTYKSGTFKGMDITLGNSNQYCGILIRGVRGEAPTPPKPPRLGDTACSLREALIPLLGTIDIDGPCNTVNHFLSHYGVSNLTEYSEKYGDPKTMIQFKHCDQSYNNILTKGPRIGLGNKSEEYLNKPYRYGISGLKYKHKFPSPSGL